MASPLATESHSPSPRTSLRPAWPEDPAPLTRQTPSIWLQAGENSCQYGALGEPMGPPPPALGPPDPGRGGPVPQALLDTPCIVHPVPTHSPRPDSSTLFDSENHPPPRRWRSGEPSATGIRPDGPNRGRAGPPPRASDSCSAPQPRPSRQAPCIFLQRLGPRPIVPPAGWPPNSTCPPRPPATPLTSSVPPATLADGPLAPQPPAGRGREGGGLSSERPEALGRGRPG